MHGSVVALQQHLSDTGCGTEVAVNLEWGVGIKQVGEGASVRVLACGFLRGEQLQHIGQDGQSVVAIQHAGPEAYFPAQTPAGGFVTALLQSLAGGGKEFVVAVGTDLVGWIQTVQMRDVTMLVVRVIGIVQPFLQLLVLSYLHRG